MKKTIFCTPLVNDFFCLFSRLILKLFGWRIISALPDKHKFILLGAPHTSNWDFILMLLAAFSLKINIHWMGKDSLFPASMAWFVTWLGGIAINRNQANNTVEQMIHHYQQADDLIVVIAPEGTRSKVERWKTGFYHIAVGAGVPIMMGYIDSKEKTLGFRDMFYPTGDVDKDMLQIQHFYQNKQGINPELH